jgi:hypothetical protein
MKYHQGKYKPKHPEKYSGDPTNIIYRSSWELKFLNWCDSSPNILKYSSEETVIPYRCGTDNRLHRYFVDFKIQVLSRDGNTKTYLVEVKPLIQTSPPKFPGRQTKRYLTESLTFIKNQSKWKAATEYAKDRGWEFKIITEKDLGI